jgi:hypothetical protein
LREEQTTQRQRDDLSGYEQQARHDNQDAGLGEIIA